MSKVYQCAECHGVFEYEPGWDDEDAEAEHVREFDQPSTDAATICDDCYTILMRRLKG